MTVPWYLLGAIALLLLRFVLFGAFLQANSWESMNESVSGYLEIARVHEEQARHLARVAYLELDPDEYGDVVEHGELVQTFMAAALNTRM